MWALSYHLVANDKDLAGMAFDFYTLEATARNYWSPEQSRPQNLEIVAHYWAPDSMTSTATLSVAEPGAGQLMRM